MYDYDDYFYCEDSSLDLRRFSHCSSQRKPDLAYISARAEPQTVIPNTSIVYGAPFSSHGDKISHIPLTTNFILEGGYNYYIEFGVNGLASTLMQGMFFAVTVNSLAKDGRATSSNINGTLPYNSAWGSYFVSVPCNETYTITIQNIGLDTITNTNSSISILQVSGKVN